MLNLNYLFEEKGLKRLMVSIQVVILEIILLLVIGIVERLLVRIFHHPKNKAFYGGDGQLFYGF